ncbi:MAG: alanine racemase [Pseudomonadota bacterium]
MTRPAVAWLSRANLRSNFLRARALTGGRPVYVVVKADGYGHGLLEVARTLLDSGAEAFAVACLEEAIVLRDAGITEPVLLLEGHANQPELAEALALRLQLVVHCEEQLADLGTLTETYPARIWLKCDSGMGRLGFLPGEVPRAWAELQGLAPLEAGLMMHFATADDPGHPAAVQQCLVSGELRQSLGVDLVSLCNSAALLRALDDRDVPRVGLMLYGASPVLHADAADVGLTPVATFESELIAVRDLPAGATVGYGQTWVAPRSTRLGIVAAGYGDGYPRHAGSGTPTLVRGQRAPLIGRVSMDMLAVDLTDIEGCERGERVELWGANLPVEEVARAANTIPYTLMCGLSSRVRRVWCD